MFIITDHETNIKARAAAAAIPKTRVSNPTIIASDAPLVDWAVELGEAVDEELELVTTVVKDCVALLVAAPLEVRFAAGTDEVALDVMDEAAIEEVS